MSAAPNPSTYDQAVTLTATVTPSVATGKVTFYDGTSPIGTSAVINGTGTFSTRLLAPGRRSILARYDGDASYTVSSSAVVAQTVHTVVANAFRPIVSYTPGNLPTAMVSADVNGDGLADLLVLDQTDGSVRILIGKADGSFTVSGTLSAGSNPQALIAADVNGDGFVDVIVADATSPGGISVSLGHGDGTFAGPANYVTSADPRALAIGDFNGDGFPDIAVAFGNSTGAAILINNGNGTFRAPVAIGQGLTAEFVLVGDFNGDGKADLAIPDNNTNKIYILSGNGNGTFQTSAGYATAPTVISGFAADFNGDGKMDIVVGTANGSNLLGAIFTLLGNGDGSFQPAQKSFGFFSVQTIVTGDFNGDGIVDLATSFGNGVAVWPGVGNGSFQFPNTPLSAGGSSFGIATGDFNQDGREDLAITDSTRNQVDVFIAAVSSTAVLTASPNPGNAGQAVTLTASITPPSATGTVKFLNGTTVLGTQSLSSGTVSISTNVLGAGSHFLTAIYPGDSATLGSTAMITFNVTGSPSSLTLVSSSNPSLLGHPVTLSAAVNPNQATGFITFYDGVVVLGTSPIISNGSASLTTSALSAGVHLLSARYGAGATVAPSTSGVVRQTVTASAGTSFGAGIVSGAGVFPTAFRTADLNGDGKLDVILLSNAANTLNIFLNSGNGTFQGPATIHLSGSNAADFAIGDLNGDGKADIALSYNGGLQTFLGNGDGTFQAPTTITGTGYSSVMILDLNGDGKADVVLADFSFFSLEVLFGNGDGTLQPLTTVPFAFGGTTPVAGDFNGDGFPDMVVPLLGQGVAVLLNKGTGFFNQPQPLPMPAGTTATAILVRDLNGDGKDDVVLALDNASNNSNAVAIFLGNGNGTFQAGASYSLSAPATSITVSDFNGDGKADLAVAKPDGIVSLIGNGDGTFQSPVSLTSAAATSLASSDFNGDGIADLLYIGTNTPGFTVLPGSFSCFVTPSGAGVPNFDKNGGSGTISITAPGSCGWNASADSNWITLSSTSGSGNATLTVTVSANPTGLSRSGHVIVSGQPVQIFQWATAVTFSDVPVSTYYFDAVNLLSTKGITAGCGTNIFCPTQSVSRAEMAVFLVRAVLGGDPVTYNPAPYFTDVPTSYWAFKWIQVLKDLSITLGCGPGIFCPDNTVTRDQGAIFLIRARYGATTTFDYPSTPFFTDVPVGYFAYPWIQRLKQDFITGGCTITAYCPGNPVIRGDMAIFVMRAGFNQLLPSSAPIIAAMPRVRFVHGTTQTLNVTGVNTNFVQGSTMVNPIPGFTIGTVTVLSPTSLSVQLTAGGTPTLSGSIWVTTNTGGVLQEAVLPNVLSIQ